MRSAKNCVPNTLSEEPARKPKTPSAPPKNGPANKPANWPKKPKNKAAVATANSFFSADLGEAGSGYHFPISLELQQQVQFDGPGLRISNELGGFGGPMVRNRARIGSFLIRFRFTLDR